MKLKHIEKLCDSWPEQEEEEPEEEEDDQAREMAHAEVVSLMFTIEDLLYYSDISLAPHSREILKFAYKQVEFLEEIARRVLWSSTKILHREIKRAAYKLKRAIKSHVHSEDEESNIGWSQFSRHDYLQDELKDAVNDSQISYQIDLEGEKSNGDGIQSSIDLEVIKQDIHSFEERVKEMEEKMKLEYIEKLCYSWPGQEEEEEEDDAAGGHKSKMVGLSDQYIELKSILMDDSKIICSDVSLVGMAGIGKTTLAKEIFEDSDIVQHFNCRAWVTVGRKCELKEIQRRILAHVNPDMSDQMLAELGDEKDIAHYMKESLKGKRFLIVLDDVWDKHIVGHLQPSEDECERRELRNPFIDEDHKGRVLLTTRLHVDKYDHLIPHPVVRMRFLNKVESWDLLCKKVFAEELCPPQLEKAGKTIAENCDGLPLTIVAVADLLSKAEKTSEYWSKVAAQKNHQLFIAAYDKISKVLLPSYKFLPPLLQMCFLYMGVFPQNDEIPRSKLINMWNVDGFLEPNVDKFRYPSAMECLEELVSNSLVEIYQSSIDLTLTSNQLIKTCGLHSSLWHLSKTEARKTKFSQILNSYKDGLGEDIKSQHRLCFHNNILFGIKEVNNSVEDNCAPTARSLLCYGPYHQYQVPLCFGLKLLKELDALTIRFYEFPMEVLQLVQLRYLALTLNEKQLPASISRLSKLQFLIVGQHSSIKSCRDHPSYLPMEIWDMKKLQHIQVMGSDLPDPCGISLESLSTLSDISAQSCVEGVLKAVPNLRKLGIRIELALDDDGECLGCFDHISHLNILESLKCVVVNPGVVSPPGPLPVFPSHLRNLKKLSLSGLGYPWKEMSKLAPLRYLTVLKLRNYAFRGPKWEVDDKAFFELYCLVIENTDLVEWKFGYRSFHLLQRLSIKYCYKLEKIHGDIGPRLGKLEIVDCNPSVVEQAKKALPPHSWAEVDVHSSWDDGKLKT